MDVCGNQDFLTVLKFIGWVFYVFKIVIPILLIAYGSFDLGKAVIASKEDEIKGATKKLVNRAIAAVVIFFIPTIVGFIFGIVGSSADDSTLEGGEPAYKSCQRCFVSPSKC